MRAGPDGKAAIGLRAKNVLPVPGTLPLTTPAAVQLKAWHAAVPGQPTVDACWAATYSTLSQSAARLKGSSD